VGPVFDAGAAPAPAPIVITHNGLFPVTVAVDVGNAIRALSGVPPDYPGC